MPKKKNKADVKHGGDRQISVWLPPEFVERVNAFVEKRQSKSRVARQTIKMLVFDALNEFMENHPDG